MNYGKLAYNAVKDTNMRVNRLEKIKELIYGQASTTQGNLSSATEQDTSYVYFKLNSVIPLLIEVNLDIATSSNVNCEVEAYLDNVLIYKEPLELSSIDAKREVRVNVAGVSAGTHCVHIRLYQPSSVFKSATVTCFGSGIGEDKQSSSIKKSVAGGANYTAKRTPQGCAVFKDDTLIHLHRGVKKFDILAHNATHYSLAFVDKKNRLHMVCSANMKTPYCLFVAENVTAVALCECVSRYEGVMAFVKNGELYYTELIDYRNYLPPDKIDLPVLKITDIAFIRNETLSHVLLVKADKGMCYSVEIVRCQPLGTLKGSLSCSFDMVT